jgi:hypothetical protein
VILVNLENGRLIRINELLTDDLTIRRQNIRVIQSAIKQIKKYTFLCFYENTNKEYWLLVIYVQYFTI